MATLLNSLFLCLIFCFCLNAVSNIILYYKLVQWFGMIVISCVSLDVALI